ncbi:MAG: hypothetical protein ACLQBA_12870 [Candidatus Binataceae bacterium]
MALVHCTKCGHYPVSTSAPKCPRCGASPYRAPKLAPTAIAPEESSRATESSKSITKQVPAYAQICGILAVALAVAGVFIPLVGVLFLTPIAIVLGSVALYGGYKVVGVTTLVVVIVNFLITPTFWLNILAGASESGASGNRWLACFDIVGVSAMLYLTVRKPRRPGNHTVTYPIGRRNVRSVAGFSSVAAGLLILAAIAYRFVPSAEFAPAPSSPARPVSPPSPAASAGKIEPAHSSLPESTTAASSAAAATSTSAAREVYVLVGSNNGVVVYRVDKTGAAAVVATIGGPLTGLESPGGMTLDEHGQLYVINSSSVVEFAAGAIGNVLPAAIIAGPATQLNGPAAITVDTAGDIYVANGVLSSGNCILEFAPTASGNSAPIATFGARETGFLSWCHDLALGGSGYVYASWADAVVEYTHAGDRMRALSGPATGLDSPEGIAIDASGNLYVTNSGGNSVTAYRPDTDGAAAPFLTIFGPATRLQRPHRIAVDGSGQIYVANSSGLEVLIFRPGSNGDIAPAAVIKLPTVSFLKDAWGASVKAIALAPPIRTESPLTGPKTPIKDSGSGSAGTSRPALLPVPNTANQEDDLSQFEPAPPGIVLHEFILLGGWFKEPQFEALRQWLLGQGFLIKQALAPQPWRTYPSIKFSGTVAQIGRAFHVTVMQGTHASLRCYAVFANLRMPARLAPEGATYIEGFNFGEDSAPGLRTRCF